MYNSSYNTYNSITSRAVTSVSRHDVKAACTLMSTQHPHLGLFLTLCRFRAVGHGAFLSCPTTQPPWGVTALCSTSPAPPHCSPSNQHTGHSTLAKFPGSLGHFPDCFLGRDSVCVLVCWGGALYNESLFLSSSIRLSICPCRWCRQQQ